MNEFRIAFRRRGSGALAGLLLLGAIGSGSFLPRARADEALGAPAGSPVLPLREGEPLDAVDAFLESLPPAGNTSPPPDPGQQSPIFSVRPIQFTYVSGGGTVVVLWKLIESAIDRIAVRVDGAVVRTIGKDPEGRFPGGVRLNNLRLGVRRLGFEAFLAGGGKNYLLETDHTVLAESPVLPVEITRWIAYAFHPEEANGRLEVQWRKPGEQDDDYIEFEFFVNGIYQGRRAAGENVLTFSRMRPGEFKVQIVAFTENYASPPAERRATGQPVEAPTRAECERVLCGDSGMRTEIAFELPPFDVPDAIAVWALVKDERRFIGIVNASPRRLAVDRLPPVPVTLELAGVVRTFEEGDPLILSGLPGVAGQILQAGCRPRPECIPLDWFRRGDVEVDGDIQITDAIAVIGFLFLGLDSPGCLDAMDSNDDGAVDISDCIYLLKFLFLGTVPPPPPPGPLDCGPDPTPDKLGNCRIPACAT